MAVPRGYKWDREVVARRAASSRRPRHLRFEKYVMPEPNSGCWLWTGSVSRTGYGQLRSNHSLEFASHVALDLAGRPRPPGLSALHDCDNTYCVNPGHLRWGTQKENAADMMARNRANLTGLALGRLPKPADKRKPFYFYVAPRPERGTFRAILVREGRRKSKEFRTADDARAYLLELAKSLTGARDGS